MYGPLISTYADLMLNDLANTSLAELAGAAQMGALGAEYMSISADDFFLGGSGKDDNGNGVIDQNERAGGSLKEDFEMSSKTLSLFANAEFSLTDDWTASIGLNKTKDEKHVTSDVIVEDVFASIPWELINPQLAGFKFFPPFTAYPEAGRDFDSDDLTHTFRLTHDYSDDTKVYVSHSTGFKPTSVNLSVNATTPDTRAADPEFSENIEIGVKRSHESGYINAAFFNQNIEGFQSNTFVGTGFQLVNAGDQRHEGLEIDIKQQLSEDWALGLSAIKINAEYESFVNGPCETVTEGIVVFPSIACDEGKRTKDLSGTTPAGISDWSANLNATYTTNLSNTLSSFLRLEYVYESEVAVVDNVPAVRSPFADVPGIADNTPAIRSTKNFNMSIGFNHAPSGVEVMLWGRNLTNHQSLLSAFPTAAAPGSVGGYPNMPRTYGLTARSVF